MTEKKTEKRKYNNEFTYFKGLITKKRNKIEHLIKDQKERLKEPEFQDLCTEYMFDKFQDIIRFNERFNEMLFFLDIDYSQDLIIDIEDMILLEANSIFMLFGPRNMSKSEFAQKLGKIIQEKNLELKNRETVLRSLADDKKMRKIFRKMKPGDITIRDESPKSGGEGRDTARDCLNNICSITRGGEYCFFFCNPTIIRMGDVDYYIEMAGKKIVHECSNCGEKVFNAKKRRIKKCPLCGCNLDYEKDLCLEDCSNRAILYDREYEILGFLFLGLHDDDEFRQEYRKQKNANIKKVMAAAGFIGAGQEGDQLEYDAKRLSKFCLETLSHKSKLFKSDIKAQIPMFNQKYPDEEIVGIYSEIKNLLSITLNKMERKRAKQKEKSKEKSKDLSLPKDQGPLNIDFSDFKCNNKEIFNNIRKRAKWQNIERDLSIYELVSNNYDKKALAKLHEIKVPAVEAVVKKVQGALNYYKGKIFEKFVKNKLERSTHFKNIDMWGGSGEPDLLAYTDTELFIISIKNLKLKDNQRWLSKEELTPEINFALLSEDDYKTYMIVLILDNLTGEIIKRDYDFHNPRDINLEKFSPETEVLAKKEKPQVEKLDISNEEFITQILLEEQKKGVEDHSTYELVYMILERRLSKEKLKLMCLLEIGEAIREFIPSQLYLNSEFGLESLSELVSKEIEKS